MRKIHLYMDGDKICATWDDFINLQESPAGFGDTIWQAFGNLIDNTPAIETNAIVTSIENAAVEDRDRASEYNNKTAVALLNELSSIKPYGRSVVSDKAYEILERWTQAQSLPQAQTTGSTSTVQGCETEKYFNGQCEHGHALGQPCEQCNRS